MAKKKRLHLIVANLEEPGKSPSIDNLIINAQYHKTNKERNLGDLIQVNGKPMTIIVLGYDKKTVVEEVNNYIQKQNRYISIQQEYYNTDLGKRQLEELENMLNDLGIEMLP